ncbi:MULTISPECIES: GntR family transcriptional regulator [unclassified Streptomyces]|uniref:GntR family transcriptional regulator n=1 Tax=unclassified Streptomyces TaxID=2593676 RepID=UPI00081B9A93|nr:MULTISPECIES: GntR family transcriptional regulator [unclassified Streptomyces]SCD81665.1 GntR family transcriptional regulator [Streptomyces sp. DvalAA-43]
MRRGMTKAQEIAYDLRERISSGALAGGAALPSESKMMSEYGYSRETIRAGVRLLIDEGLVVAGQGQGKYVREDYPPVVWNWSTLESRSRHANAVEGQTAGDQWASAVTEEGKTPRQEITVSIVEPPAHVRECLELPSAGLAVARKRVRYVDNRPYALADSYFPQELVTGTPLMEPRDVSAPGGVLASVGLVQAKYRDEISVRMPTRQEAETLALPAATPVAEHTRTGYDATGRPLRCMVTILPGDRHKILYEVTTD